MKTSIQNHHTLVDELRSAEALSYVRDTKSAPAKKPIVQINNP